LWKFLLRQLRQEEKLNLSLLSIDGSLMESFSFADTTGYSGKHHQVGIKVSILADEEGLPLGTKLNTGNVNDISLAEETAKKLNLAPGFLLGSTLLADKGYDSLQFRIFCLQQGIVPCIPRRNCTGVREKDWQYYLYNKREGRKRFVVERTTAWIKSFRRLRHRFDYQSSSFEAFLKLAILVICVRRLIP
jgi:transposase